VIWAKFLYKATSGAGGDIFVQGFWAEKRILTCPQVAISGIVYFDAVVARDREDGVGKH
jgi:hypothetical protein